MKANIRKNIRVCDEVASYFARLSERMGMSQSQLMYMVLREHVRGEKETGGVVGRLGQLCGG